MQRHPFGNRALQGALILSGSLSASAWAQTTPPAKPAADAPTRQTSAANPPASTPVVIEGQAFEREGKDSLRATDSRIGKGLQSLRDIPQSITVITEKLMDDRNLDTVKEALKQSAGISFLAAEGGEEDIRLRGFSLQATGDVFLDGMREPAFYERDSFALDRLEVLRGSASMLFGRGSTGGAVNQVLRTPRAMDEGSFDLTLGSHQHRRAVLDINKGLGTEAGVRLGAMVTKADNNGSGSSLDKYGLTGAIRWGIGTPDEFLVQGYHLHNRNGMNYGLPWIRPTGTSPVTATTILPLPPEAYYGMGSDINHGSATHLAGVHTHRWADRSELRTQVRLGQYERNQRASTIRLAAASAQPDQQNVTLQTFSPATVFNRGTQLKIQDMDTVYAQSDYTTKWKLAGLTHQVTAGVDLAVEKKTVYAARTGPNAQGANPQGGVTLLKPTTTAGTPDDGAGVDESTRVLRVNNQYSSLGWGAYVQDLVAVTAHWKLLGGLRWDSLQGDFDAFGAPPNAVDNGPKTSYRMKVGEWSQRAGVLYQPTPRHSFHASAGTSFNTSGDAYSLGASNVDTPPEKSINLEVGAKIDSQDKRFSTRLAAFRATKLRERNTDPLLPVVTLTGRRHVAGLEADVAGRLTPAWEVYASFTWMPVARVDEAAPCPATGACAQAAPGERVGDRPALTPKHSGSVWSTWQLDPRWRVGAGLTLRGRQTPTRAEFEVKSFTVGDLMVEHATSERTRLKLNISNVTDHRYADQLYPGHYVPGAGRLVQLTASYQY